MPPMMMLRSNAPSIQQKKERVRYLLKKQNKNEIVEYVRETQTTGPRTILGAILCMGW
jgi:hypothetical protein